MYIRRCCFNLLSPVSIHVRRKLVCNYLGEAMRVTSSPLFPWGEPFRRAKPRGSIDYVTGRINAGLSPLRELAQSKRSVV